MSQFHAIAAGLHTALQSHRGLSATYHRGGASVAIVLVAGLSRALVDDGAGVAVSTRERDWIVKAADLVLDGQTVLPARGDRIRVPIADRVEVYEVGGLGGERHYSACDEAATVLRIHTRRIDTENAA